MSTQTQTSPALFLYGTLRHLPLLEIVAGGPIQTRPARLPEHRAHRVAGADYPMIHPAEGEMAEGLLIHPDAQQRARLDFYEGGHGYGLRQLTVQTDEGPRDALVYWPDGLSAAEPWDAASWIATRGALQVEAARDAMEMFGRQSPETVARRFPSILVRAQARLNARMTHPATLRRDARPDDVQIARRHIAYAGFFAVEDYVLRHRRFDGGLSPDLHRAVFISADAVSVLPYDPARDRVMLVEQFRMGPTARGDTNPWLLEPIAGRMDPGETPRQTALRETREETGLEVARLIPLPAYYPSPGAKTEFVTPFLALADLPDEAAGVGGLDSEHEDIRAHVLSFDAVMALLDTGELANGPLVLSVLHLMRMRPDLRRAA